MLVSKVLHFGKDMQITELYFQIQNLLMNPPLAVSSGDSKKKHKFYFQMENDRQGKTL